MTMSSTDLLTILDFQQPDFGTVAPNDGEYLSTAMPKMVSNMLTLYNMIALPQRLNYSFKPPLSSTQWYVTPSLISAVSLVAGSGTTANNTVVAAGNNMTRRRRMTYTTGTTAGSAGGTLIGYSFGLRSSFDGAGGFVQRQRFGSHYNSGREFSLFHGDGELRVAAKCCTYQC